MATVPPAGPPHQPGGSVSVPHPAPPMPLRVLHLVESWPPRLAGYTVRSWELVGAQTRRAGLRPHVVVSSRQHSYRVADVASLPGEATVALLPPSSRERHLRRVRRYYLDVDHHVRALRAACRQHRPDLLHVHWSSGMGWAAAQVATTEGLPLVAEVRFDLAGVVMTETVRVALAPLERWMRHRFERHLAWADAVVAASHSLADLLRHEVPALPPRLCTIPNGVVCDRFCPAPADADLRARLGLEGRLVIGTTSTMQRYEGLDLLVRAAARLRSTHPRLHLLFVGTGVQERALRRLARRLGVPATFAGRVPHAAVPAYLRLLDIFALPRRDATVTRHASPIKLVEALAAGRAVVASRVGDVPRLLGEGTRGRLVAPGAVDALALALADLAQPEVRPPLERSARAWAEQAPTWADAAEQTEQLYRDVLRG